VKEEEQEVENDHRWTIRVAISSLL